MTHDVDVLIIGAGMSGIGLAIQLVRQHGTRNFELIEKSDHVGGTWWLNSYPGCGCDVSSQPSVKFFFRCCLGIDEFIVLGPFSLLLLFVRFEPELVPEVRHAARDLRLL